MECITGYKQGESKVSAYIFYYIHFEWYISDFRFAMFFVRTYKEAIFNSLNIAKKCETQSNWLKQVISDNL